MNVWTGSNVPVKAWADGVDIQPEAITQALNAASLPFVFRHVALMPDAHWGMGSTVGSVIPTLGAIIPAAVGVDLGCGMMATRTTLQADQLPDSLFGVRSDIERAIPVGGPGVKGSWKERGRHGAPPDVETAWSPFDNEYRDIVRKHGKVAGVTVEQLGTLGTGNHFIEVCLDEEDRVWVMLHSGSRGLGNRIGSYFIAKAKDEMRRWHINLPDADLAYLPQGSEFFGEYVRAVRFAQNFARVNRELMMRRALAALEMSLPIVVEETTVNCHHNYVQMEHHFGKDVWVTRKGAVDASEGQLGIVPGSMGAKSFIVRGKGNPDSFRSCSHGAGRAMSRGEARRRFTVEDHAKATAGIECRKDAGVIDETPAAYKDIDAVMAAQADLVDIVHTLRQVLCVKG